MNASYRLADRFKPSFRRCFRLNKKYKTSAVVGTPNLRFLDIIEQVVFIYTVVGITAINTHHSTYYVMYCMRLRLFLRSDLSQLELRYSADSPEIRSSSLSCLLSGFLISRDYSSIAKIEHYLKAIGKLVNSLIYQILVKAKPTWSKSKLK